MTLGIIYCFIGFLTFIFTGLNKRLKPSERVASSIVWPLSLLLYIAIKFDSFEEKIK